MAFKSSLIIVDDFGLPYQLYQELIYSSKRLGRDIVVPVGFWTDLASIPKGFWNILPKSERYDRAAVLHDYLYQFNGCSRADADGVLEEAMKDLNVNGLKLRIIYLGVRAGGWKKWGEYRAAQKAQGEALSYGSE